MKLTTPLPELRGIKRVKGYNILPASPTLLKSLNINAPAYLQERQKLIDHKTQPTSISNNLRDYQNQDVGFLMLLKNKGIFSQQRTGKTPTTLVTMKKLKETNAVIICPGSVLYKWYDEYKKWHKGPVATLSSSLTKPQRTKIIEEFEGTLIMTYGIARNDEALLLKRKPQTIVVDEAHRLRNFKGMRSKYSPQITKTIIRLSQKAESRYALTGTPVPNKPENIFGILAFLFPNLFISYWDFIEYYFIIEDVIINSELDTIKQIQGFRNKNKEKEMQELLELISVQRKRKEVMPWLTEIEPTLIKIPPNPKQEKYLKELDQFFEIAEEELLTVNGLEKMLREMQIAIEPKLLDLKAKGVKTPWLKEYIQDYPEKSVIIVSTFTSYLHYLKREIFPDATLLIGSTSDVERARIEKDLNNKKINLILANLDVIKEGMTLHGADAMIFVNNSLTYTDNEQAFDRLLPTTEEIASEKELQEIIILITDTKIENYLYKMMKLKKSKTDIINNYKKYLETP